MSYQLELRHIRYFLAVAEHLHFRKAADQLYISQPGLSKQIKEMEEGLGITLFYRSKRTVTLTKAGEYLKEELSRQSKNLSLCVDHARLVHGGLKGDLRIGYVGSAIQQIIPHLLISFRKKSPKVLFSLTEMDNISQINSLISREIDIGFVRQERVPRGVQILPVLKEHFCLVLPADHQVNENNFASLSQFKDEPFILFDPNYSSSYYEKVMQIFDDSGFSPQVMNNTIHANSIYKLVEHKFGISIIPNSLRLPHVSGVKFIELKSMPQRTTLSAIWSENNNNPVFYNFYEEINKMKFQ